VLSDLLSGRIDLREVLHCSLTSWIWPHVDLGDGFILGAVLELASCIRRHPSGAVDPKRVNAESASLCRRGNEPAPPAASGETVRLVHHAVVLLADISTEGTKL
jgi:hypothetical protein